MDASPAIQAAAAAAAAAVGMGVPSARKGSTKGEKLRPYSGICMFFILTTHSLLGFLNFPSHINI